MLHLVKHNLIGHVIERNKRFEIVHHCKKVMLYIGGITMFHIFIMCLLLIIVEVNMDEIHQLFVWACFSGTQPIFNSFEFSLTIHLMFQCM
jgi:hypothetical protein